MGEVDKCVLKDSLEGFLTRADTGLAVATLVIIVPKLPVRLLAQCDLFAWPDSTEYHLGHLL